MKVFLDDERKAPEGWMQARWPAEAIRLLETGRVTEISLDHDLGNDERGTGYDVIRWIEEAVATQGFEPPEIKIHTANSSAREKMRLGADSIRRLSRATENPYASSKRLELSDIIPIQGGEHVNRLSAIQFLDAFAAEWQESISKKPDGIAGLGEVYVGNKSWTEYLLAEETGLFDRVANRLSEFKGLSDLGYYREWDKIDAMFAGGGDGEGGDVLGRRDAGYPARIYVLIENENGNFPEEEMYKLLWRRAPLKVLLFNDWSDDLKDRNAGNSKGRWLDEKLKLFRTLHAGAQEFCAEPRDTTYLLLVAARETDMDTVNAPRWRWAAIRGGEMVGPCLLQERNWNTVLG